MEASASGPKQVNTYIIRRHFHHSKLGARCLESLVQHWVGRSRIVEAWQGVLYLKSCHDTYLYLKYYILYFMSGLLQPASTLYNNVIRNQNWANDDRIPL